MRRLVIKSWDCAGRWLQCVLVLCNPLILRNRWKISVKWWYILVQKFRMLNICSVFYVPYLPNWAHNLLKAFLLAWWPQIIVVARPLSTDNFQGLWKLMFIFDTTLAFIKKFIHVSRLDLLANMWFCQVIYKIALFYAQCFCLDTWLLILCLSIFSKIDSFCIMNIIFDRVVKLTALYSVRVLIPLTELNLSGEIS